MTAAQRHLEAGDLRERSSRSLATEAGVSHSLVNFHFGGRDGLLAAAAAVRIAPHDVIAASTRDDGTLDLARLATAIVALWEHPEHGETLRQLAVDVASGAPRSSAFHDYLQHAVVERLQDALGAERGRAVATAVVGTLFARYVIRLPAFADPSPQQAVRHLLVAFGERR
nr:TetR family transcriptional regulator [Agrococcus sp. ARC_14]